MTNFRNHVETEVLITELMKHLDIDSPLAMSFYKLLFRIKCFFITRLRKYPHTWTVKLDIRIDTLENTMVKITWKYQKINKKRNKQIDINIRLPETFCHLLPDQNRLFWCTMNLFQLFGLYRNSKNKINFIIGWN